MKSVTFELGDIEYEITITSFDLGTPAKGWDPGAGAEVEIDDHVSIWGNDADGLAMVIERITLDEFMVLYTLDRSIQKMSPSDTRAAARAQFEEEVIEKLIDQLEDDYDDQGV